MLPEPTAAIPNGEVAYTLKRGAPQGMRFRVWGTIPVRPDDRWLSDGHRRGVQTVAPQVLLYCATKSETSRGSKLRHTSLASMVRRPASAIACADGAAPPASRA